MYISRYQVALAFVSINALLDPAGLARTVKEGAASSIIFIIIIIVNKK